MGLNDFMLPLLYEIYKEYVVKISVIG